MTGLSFGLIKFRVDTSQARLKLNALGKGFRDRETLSLVGDRVLRYIDHQYDTGGYGSWAPLKPNTVVWKGHSQPLIGKTKRLRNSWYKRVQPGYGVTIHSTDPKSVFHEYGTRPHRIEARGAKMLRFQTASGMRYARAVDHPGVPARPVLPPKDYAKLIAELAVLVKQRALMGAGR